MYVIFAIIALAIILSAAFWIGIYVVLPLCLLGILGSVIASIVRAFIPNRPQPVHHLNAHQKNKENQIIDVEFEEIK